jgi:pantoate--beta-alanine ligase
MTKHSSGSKQRRPRTIRTLNALKATHAIWRARRDKIALVPTMGALHAGHISLVRLAQRRADRVIVSIFVNPSQFAPGEDLNAYPRTFAADVAALADLQADLIWAPAVETMYPPGFASRVVPEGPATVGLEDAYRPHFFAGVATVVAKLLIQCEPDIAVFGEKDYQQLKVVTQLARDLDLKSRIIGAPIVREADGLALSSRNRYLSPAERAAAPVLYQVLTACAAEVAAGKAITGVLEKGRTTITNAGFVVDYLEVRDAKTLAPVTSAKRDPIRLLVAARLGKTRLIDNVAV